MKELKRGAQIAYVPMHANRNLAHPDTEYGFVTSLKPGVAYCRYWSKHHDGELRTKANSEGTPIEYIVMVDTVSQELVEEMLEKYCA